MSLYTLGEIARLQLSTFDVAGAAADAGTVTLSVTPPTGTPAACTPIVHTNGTGVYAYDYPTTLVGPHLPAWSATGANATADVRRFDVYGATIATPAEMRDRYGDKIASTTTYPDAKVRKALKDAVDQWNELAQVAMAPFSRRITHLGDGCTVLALPNFEVRSIVSLVIGGTTVPGSSYLLDGAPGLLYLTSGTFTVGKAVVVHYEHGLDTPPGPVVEAVMQRAYELLIPPIAGSGRVSATSNDAGYTKLSLAGRDGTTGVPDFDSTAALYGRQGLGFA